MTYLFEEYHGIKVAWLPRLDGGGRDFGKSFVPVVRSLFGKVDRVFEFCAGPGFIGFMLLAENLCNSLCLADVNPEAVEVVRKTIELNGLRDKVSVYLSDVFGSIPESEQWDLVVSNPPHFKTEIFGESSQDIRTLDPRWEIHKKFYTHIHRYLKPHGSVLIQENYKGSQEDDFLPLIQEGGLQYVGCFMVESERHRDNTKYFMWSKKKYRGVVWQQAGSSVLLGLNLSELVQSTKARAVRSGKYRFRIYNDLGNECGVFLTKESKEGQNGRLQNVRLTHVPVCPVDRYTESTHFLLNPGRYFVTNELAADHYLTLEVS